MLGFGPALLRDLVLRSDSAPLPLGLLWFLFCLTFGSAQLGAARLAEDD